jgi:small subunit ribosomal protein S9
MPNKEQQTMERALGRRKTAAARVRLTAGKGNIIVNDKPLATYFPILILQKSIVAPLETVGRKESMDVSVKVAGGGVHGQAEAVRHGIARALVKWDADLKPVLKAEGFLTRDSRAKERKKYGRHKARRGHQWKKR